MITTIDQAGRVVIPKSLRNQFHLVGGTQVEIISDGSGLRLQVPQTASAFEEKDGVLVQRGEPSANVDATDFINRQRNKNALGAVPQPDSR